ncbi:glycosyltransferase [Actinoplanes sp. NEAU-A12]|uniref:Glycosyltransferase n=1 Tax=Actinoplanes sandaracinus TaxID=3045177 RepID=A0ABT6X0E5_9ACTN|nr:glycosyltransferase [Actinoplanes sandaracinus]MDI6105479.1 glycosyltransferase [Actinoplanes sandaracinus]
MISPPLRIALLSYRSKPHSGGQGIYVRHLSRELVRLGHQVEVFSGPPLPDLDDGVGLTVLPSLDLYREPDPFRTPRLSEFRTPVDVLEWTAMCTGAFPEPLTFSLRAWRFLRERLSEFDIVHDNQCLGYGLLPLSRSDTPVVATIHHPITVDRDLELAAAPDWKRRLSLRRWYAFTRMQGRVARNLPWLTTVSNAARDEIVEAFRVPAERLRVIGVGVDVDTFSPAGNTTSLAGSTTVESDTCGGATPDSASTNGALGTPAGQATVGAAAGQATVSAATTRQTAVSAATENGVATGAASGNAAVGDAAENHAGEGGTAVDDVAADGAPRDGGIRANGSQGGGSAGGGVAGWARGDRIVAVASADVPLKGLPELIEAVAKLRADHDVELVVVGSARPDGAAARAIARLGLDRAVRFVSGISDDELADLFRSATVAAVPSRYEGFSLPAVEAMACGVPLVVTTAGALPEVTGPDGLASLHVAPGDAEALSAAIGRLLDDEALRRRLGAAGRRRAVEHFTWRRTAMRTAEWYAEAIEEHRKRRRP